MSYVGCFAILILCFHAKIYLPFSPIPLSMMSFGVLLVGALFPFRVAMICFATCLIEGFLGSPLLLANTLTFGACFGYYIGMVVAIFFLAKVAKNNKMPLLLSLALANLLIWYFGVSHLQSLVGIKNALLLGVVPFVIGDTLKAFIAYGLIQYTLKKTKA